jgi:lipopolysaccharide/colanic/teichoic acid biosynthesis glycosyltransferase
MKNDSESDGVFSTNGNRVTAFGKFMRKTRIDEFPQFLNVLKGDMAVVGPRPERPFVKKFQVMPFYETRHMGTGWAQVNYSYGASIDDSN